MTAPLDHVRAKIARARAHFAGFPTLDAELAEANAAFVTIRENVATGTREYVVAHNPIVPVGYPLLAGDSIHNLRGALDHLAYALCAAGPGGVASLPAADLKQLQFPITSGGLIEYRALRSRRLLVDYARKGVEPVLDAVEPYVGGAGHAISWLSQLNNIDKHRLLFTVALQVPALDIGHFMLESMRDAMPERMQGFAPGSLSIFANPADKSALKAGDLVYSEPLTTPIGRARLKFPVSLNEPDVLAPQPLKGLLEHMASSVEALLPAFEPFVR